MTEIVAYAQMSLFGEQLSTDKVSSLVHSVKMVVRMSIYGFCLFFLCLYVTVLVFSSPLDFFLQVSNRFTCIGPLLLHNSSAESNTD